MIYIVLDGLPPSSNQAYVDRPGGGRVLTRAGTKYKKDVIQHIVKNYASQTQELAKDVTIGCLLCFGFPDMLNIHWPKKSKSRYKRQDVENRTKLLVDAIQEATAMDDSQICFFYKYKYQSEKPLTTVYIWNEDKEPIGQRVLASFTEIIGGLKQVQ